MEAGLICLVNFNYIRFPPPCSAGIIMTTTIMTIVLMRLLYKLLLNIEDLLKQNYLLHFKKQRTIFKNAQLFYNCVLVLDDRRLVQTRVIAASVASMAFNMICDQISNCSCCIIVDRINIF